MAEKLVITPNRLGPVKGSFEIRPFTLFIGKQGTGKSLVSQLLYFFRNLPYLVRYYETRPGMSNEKIVRDALEHLRSDKRPLFNVFKSSHTGTSINYYPSEPFEGKKWQIRVQFSEEKQFEEGELAAYVNQIRGGHIPVQPRGQALFIPTERVIYSHARGPSTWQLLSLPSTLIFFADALEEAARVFDPLEKREADTPEGRWIRLMGKEALAGEAVRQSEVWKWKVDEKTILDIDMASSGQKANWPIILLAQTLFAWRNEGLISEPFYIHVEEPEIHLHPAAQVAIVNILAYLVNHGFKVVVTTHSLTVLYALNNLVTASQMLPSDLRDERVPEPEVRLKPEQVNAYLFTEDGNVESIVTPAELSIEENGHERSVQWLNEDKLREVDQHLEQELNHIRTYGLLWGQETQHVVG